MSLSVVPVTLGAARVFVEQHHSHHHAPVGGLLACAVADGDRLCCVAILSRPVARMLDAQGGVAEVTRVATDRTPGAALLCLRTLTGAAVRLGWARLVSYTLLGESGGLYRQAGWRVTGLVEASQGWHSRAARTTVQGGAKVRWEYGPGALPADGAAAFVAGMCVGRVAIPSRAETLPLLAGGVR
jgi:hypothetical protein